MTHSKPSHRSIYFCFFSCVLWQIWRPAPHILFSFLLKLLKILRMVVALLDQGKLLVVLELLVEVRVAEGLGGTDALGGLEAEEAE